jgi:hypothetical protein
MRKKYPIPFYVIDDDVNRRVFSKYNVMPYFIRCYDKVRRKKGCPKTYEEIRKFLEGNSMYMFWARCQYEVILKSVKTEREFKIDVHNQIMNNFDLLVHLFMYNLGLNVENDYQRHDYFIFSDLGDNMYKFGKTDILKTLEDVYYVVRKYGKSPKKFEDVREFVNETAGRFFSGDEYTFQLKPWVTRTSETELGVQSQIKNNLDLITILFMENVWLKTNRAKTFNSVTNTVILSH